MPTQSKQNVDLISLSTGNWRQLATMRTEDVAFYLDLVHKRQTPTFIVWQMEVQSVRHIVRVMHCKMDPLLI